MVLEEIKFRVDILVEPKLPGDPFPMSSDTEKPDDCLPTHHASSSTRDFAPSSAFFNHLAIGAVLDDKYRVIAELAHGGMGTVYRAEQIMLSREVAIKILRLQADTPDDTAEFLRRFNTEAKALARIQHPNAVAVHDFGFSGGNPYLVMEFIEGKTLRRMLRDESRIPVQSIMRMMEDVCRAVHHAHLQGIIHRDLKPDNIMVSRSADGTDRVVVLDFGIAKLQDAQFTLSAPATQSGVLVGTPQYISPEQIRGGEIDARSDLYSIGIILYELLSGSLPFVGDSAVSVAMKHLSEQPPPFEVPVLPELEQLVRSCLSKERESRPADAGKLADMLAAIRQGLSGQVVMAPTQMIKPKRRKLTSYPAIAAAVCCVIFAVGYPKWRAEPVELVIEPKQPNIAPLPTATPVTIVKLSNKEVAELLDNARALSSKGNFLQAKGSLEKVLADAPDNTEALFELGKVHSELGEDKEAVMTYQTAVELGESSVTLFDNLGVSFQNIGNHGSAIASFERAIRLDSSYTPAYYHLAESYTKIKNWDKAITAYKILLELDKSNTGLHSALSNVLSQAGRPREAQDEMMKAMKSYYPSLGDYDRVARNGGRDGGGERDNEFDPPEDDAPFDRDRPPPPRAERERGEGREEGRRGMRPPPPPPPPPGRPPRF